MVRCCVVLSVAVLVAASIPAVSPVAQAKAPPAGQPVIRLGLLHGMFRDVPPNVIQAAATPFKDVFKKETGFNGDVELVDDYETLAEKLENKSLHFGVFHGYEYAWVKNQYPNLQPLVIADPKVGAVRACLVVNAEAKLESPNALKGQCVTVPMGTKAHCYLFLDRLQQNLPPNCCCPVAGPRTMGPLEALDALVEGKLSAVLVDISSLEIYRKDRVTAATKLKVLDQSENFPPGVLVYRKGAVEPAVLAKVQKGLTEVHKNSQGKAFLMIWKLNGFREPPPGYDAHLEKILKQYPPPTPAPVAGPGVPIRGPQK